MSCSGATEPTIVHRFRSTLTETPPFCSGTLGLQPRDFTLFYGKPNDQNTHRVNLSGTSAQDVDALRKLERACEAATFGRNSEAVLDTTYRKAGKMDPDNFLLGLDVDRSRLVDIVRAGLLAGDNELKPIKAELYKLNVYGQDAFFKPHRDTPRGNDMFGSLVLVFPTPHEGGALVLRHEDNEWTFDAARLLSTTAHYDLKRVAYVAFFSDVEHEVLPVTSGHRVTITYNLYWSSPPPIAFPSELSVIYPKHSNFSEVGEGLADLLADPTFLPQGGTLGFGLRHAYPFEKHWNPDMPDPLDALRDWLKGSDAALFRALQVLSLDPVLRLIYKSEDYDITAMVDHMASLPYDHAGEEDECYMLLQMTHDDAVNVTEKNFDGTLKPVKDSRERRECLAGTKSIEVYWVTPCGESNSIGSEYTAYFGNEPGVEYLYLTPSLFVDIGPVGDRANIQGIEGVHAVQAKRKYVY